MDRVLVFLTTDACWRGENFESQKVFTLVAMTNERLLNKEVLVKRAGSLVYNKRKEIKSSGASIKEFQDLLI